MSGKTNGKMENIYIVKNGKKLISIKNQEYLCSEKLKQNVEIKKVDKIQVLEDNSKIIKLVLNTGNYLMLSIPPECEVEVLN